MEVGGIFGARIVGKMNGGEEEQESAPNAVVEAEEGLHPTRITTITLGPGPYVF